MKRILFSIFTFFIIFLLTSCQKDTEILPNNQRILFQVEYLNYAWVYQHNGFLIDCSGNIYYYNNPSEWNFIEDDGTFHEEAMNENLTFTDSITHSIDNYEIIDKAAKIYQASIGPISDLKCEMADAGTIVYSAYILNNRTHKYHRILLKQSGDCSRENLSQAAIQLYQWLQLIQEKTVLKN
ncbi:hypothetical protein [Carboxylicivirga caseinilyticus]|uniref:hypothetical protein n=1 Tax=Carboxylicivirga caseinilyticus TaxID=3417572 RepID=UPI003D33DB17|nr:hypothetical protein [Marinilabiliaceae bacterium A049]